jgi:glycosyltransferase involved in cell wall biosynthesis
MNKLTISIITCTFNTDLVTFKRCLEAVKMQKFPKKSIEHLVIDAGSKNGTVELAKKYGCKVIVREELKIREQVRQSIGFKKAKGDILLVLESDNILTSPDWLEKMVKPFQDNKKLVCSFSAYNGYKKNDNLLTRYTGLFGSPHPILYYLNKSDKIPLTCKKYNKGKIVSETKDYYIIKFNAENLPTCGDNGHMILRKAMNKVNKDPEAYVHLDAMLELVNSNYTYFGVVKNTIIHVGKNNLINDIKRKVELKNEFFDKRRGQRKYLVYNPNNATDRKNLIKCIIYSLTVIIPLYESIKGYIKIRDRAWFLHPLFSFFMVIAFTISEIRFIYGNKFSKIG